LESLHERIHRYRRKRGFTQTAVAKRMGMNLSTYRLRENTGNITCEELLKLADVFQVDVMELMLGEEYYLKKNRGIFFLNMIKQKDSEVTSLSFNM